jgi:hypothetical protein
VEVDDDDRRLRARLLDDVVDHLPRRQRRLEEQHPEEIDDGDRDAVACLHDREAATRRERAGVGGADDALARREIVRDPVAAVRVVAERDDVGARAQQAVGELARDPGAVGDVLAVDDADVGA